MAEALIIAGVGVLAGAVIGGAGGSLFGGEQTTKSQTTEKIPQQKPVSVTAGTGRKYSLGPRCRIPTHALYKSKVTAKTTTETSSGKGGGASTVEVEYTADIALTVGSAVWGTDGRGRINLVKQIWIGGFLLYKDANTDANKHLYDDLEIRYAGSGATPLEVLEDKNNPPAYKGQTVIGIKKLRLNKWGGTIPSQIDVLVETNEKPFHVSTAIEHLVQFADVPTSALDIRATGKNIAPATENTIAGEFEGMWMDGPFNVRTQIEKITTAYDLVAAHEGRKLAIIDRGDEDLVEVDADDFGVYETAPADEHYYGRSQNAKRNKPEVAWVRAHFPERKWQPDAVPHGIAKNDEEYQQAVTVDLTDFAMKKKSAKRLARTRIRRAYQEDEVISISLPPKYRTLTAGTTAIHFIDPADPNTRRYARIVEITEGANFWRDLRCLSVTRRSADDPILTSLSDVYFPDDTEEGDLGDDDVGNDADDLTDPYDLVTEFLDLPPMHGEIDEATTPVFRIAHMVDAIPEVPYLGSSLYKSTNGGEKFKPANLAMPEEGAVGEALSVLPDNRYGADTQLWDYGSHVDVQFVRPVQLSQVDEDDVYESENIFLVGTELVGVQKPIKLDADGYQWRLTYLLRGMFNSEASAGPHLNAACQTIAQEGGVHVIGERVVMVDASMVGVYTKPTGFLGKMLLYKDVGIGNDESEVSPPIEFTYEGENFKPFSPACLLGSFAFDDDESDFVAFEWTWYRRSRLRYSIFETPPLLEPVERYWVRVYDLLNATPLVYTALLPVDQVSFFFSYADQVAAGVTLPGAGFLVLEVRQWSATVGEGRPSYYRV